MKRQNRYKCPLCSKNFARKSGIERHKKIHTGENPFGCQFFHRTFALKLAFSRHEVTHTGEKPSISQFCGMDVAQQYFLRLHEQTHIENNQFWCRNKMNHSQSANTIRRPQTLF